MWLLLFTISVCETNIIKVIVFCNININLLSEYIIVSIIVSELGCFCPNNTLFCVLQNSLYFQNPPP